VTLGKRPTSPGELPARGFFQSRDCQKTGRLTRGFILVVALLLDPAAVLLLLAATRAD
jgi:hypothetical protein